MTFSFLCAAVVMGSAPVQPPATAQAAPPRKPHAVRALEVVEANGAYSIQAKSPPVMPETAGKARAISIRVGNAVRLDGTLFAIGKEVDHAPDH